MDKKSLDEQRMERNKSLVERTKRGEDTKLYSSADTWYPRHKQIKKADKVFDLTPNLKKDK